MRPEDAPRYLTYLELAAELSHFTYKPGWKLSLFLDPFEGPCLRVVVDLPDAYRQNHTVQTRVNSRLPRMRYTWQFHDYLLHRLELIELHEVREFLRRDGKPLWDPHDPCEPCDEDPT